MDPFGEPINNGLNDPATFPVRCQAGAEVLLKRIFKKLFNQVNALQPSELDDE